MITLPSQIGWYSQLMDPCPTDEPWDDWVGKVFQATPIEQSAAYEHAERMAGLAMAAAEKWKDYLVHHEKWIDVAERWMALAKTFKYLSERPR